MRRRERKLWQAARTLSDLGELTAQWLEGGLRSQPGYMPNCGPDPETTELIPVLARLNRAGYVTNGSQPGVEGVGFTGGWARQRAAVEGFTSATHASQIETIAERAGLIVLCTPAPQPKRGLARLRSDRGPQVTVSEVDGTPYTGFGGMGYSDLELHAEELNDEAFGTLLASWNVTVADPEWGRNDLLWPTLDDWARTARKAAAA